MATKKIALFIDADNVSARFGKQIIDSLTTRGDIFIRRIYGNWEKTILHGWNECILNFSLRPVQQTDFVTGKNATDMSLTIDAMDVLYGGRADIFALVSNDSDFTPLAIRLREGGMNVVGLGNGHAANAFRLACSEFIDLDAPQEKISSEPVSAPVKKKSSSKENSPVQLNLFDDEKKVVEFKPQSKSPEKISAPKVVTTVAAQVQPSVKISPVVTNPKVVSISDRKIQSDRDNKIRRVHELLSEVAKTHGDKSGFTPLCWAGQTLRKKNLGFGIKDVGYSSFRAFVTAFPKLYELIHRTNGENFCYRCLDAAQVPDDEKIRQLHDALIEATKIHVDEAGFTDLSYAGNVISQKNLSLKDSGHGTLQKFVAAFPKLYEMRTTGKTVSYRCKSAEPDESRLRQLHDILRETAVYKDLNDAQGFTDLCRAGEAVKKKNLDVKAFGHGTLSGFVQSFPKLYEMRKVGNKFYYRCRNVNPDESRLRQLHDILRECAKLHGDETGFLLSVQAGQNIRNKNLGFGVKDFGYSTVREFISAFPKLYETRGDTGQTFRYRPR